MYDLETVKSTLADKLRILIDPYDTSPTPQPILSNVIRGEPDLLNLYDGPMGALIFIHTAESPQGIDKKGYFNGPQSLGQERQRWQLNVTGALVLFVAGMDDDSDTLVTHLSDVLSDFFHNENALELPGTIMSSLTTGMSMNWRPITITLENMQRPMESLTAAIKFTILVDDTKKV